LATLTEIEAAMAVKQKQYYHDQIRAKLTEIGQLIPAFTNRKFHADAILAWQNSMEADNTYDAMINNWASNASLMAFEALDATTQSSLGIDHLFE